MSAFAYDSGGGGDLERLGSAALSAASHVVDDDGGGDREQPLARQLLLEHAVHLPPDVVGALAGRKAEKDPLFDADPRLLSNAEHDMNDAGVVGPPLFSADLCVEEAI